MSKRNPFQITKAGEFNDQQINDYWIDLYKDTAVLDPLNPKPQFLLGSKGCGKTHLLRHYSYPLQKIRHKNDVKEILTQDRYIGIYAYFNSLDITRFQGSYVSEERWQRSFEYYFELYSMRKMCSIVKEIFQALNVESEIEKEIFNEIRDIITIPPELPLIDIDSFYSFLNEQLKIVSHLVNKSVYTPTMINEISISFTRGDLLFKVPVIIAKYIKSFENVRFLYIWDEFERFNNSQKKFINTLVWDVPLPCSIWIGARLYGFTPNTYNPEIIRNGSEYDPIILDDKIRENEKSYKEFARELFFHRMQKADYNIINNDPTCYFVEWRENIILSEIQKKKQMHEKPYMKKLKSLLKEHDKLYKNDHNNILANLTADNPLHEKYNLLLFYRAWAKGNNLLHSSEDIEKDYKEFIYDENNKKTGQNKIAGEYKRDLLAQLLEETFQKNTYKDSDLKGFQTFIDLSWGNPRCFLNILKYTFNWAVNEGEKIFEGVPVSLKAQGLGILETAEWFLEDVELPGKQKAEVTKGINRLCEFLRELRFAQKLPVCSPSTFSVKFEELSDSCKEMISVLEKHNLLVKVNARKDKNSIQVEQAYQVQKMLVPLWNIPISRRDIKSLSKDLAESIFDPSQFDSSEPEYKKYIKTLNVPFSIKKKRRNKQYPSDEERSLFDDY